MASSSSTTSRQFGKAADGQARDITNSALCERLTSITTSMKVNITKWSAVATWRWDIPDDDVCGICQVDFDGTCPTCKYPGDDCSLLSGKCGHNFHMHCIVEWIKQESSKGQCPMCRQKFEWGDTTAGGSPARWPVREG